ncbi:hypothetical protein D9M70_621430 [compost metagenome]
MPVSDFLQRHTSSAQDCLPPLAGNELAAHRQARFGKTAWQAETRVAADIERRGELDQALVRLRVQGKGSELPLHRGGQRLDRSN